VDLFKRYKDERGLPAAVIASEALMSHYEEKYIVYLAHALENGFYIAQIDEPEVGIDYKRLAFLTKDEFEEEFGEKSGNSYTKSKLLEGRKCELCIHYHGFDRCGAYPHGIPEEYMSEEVEHDSTQGDQWGDLIFEPNLDHPYFSVRYLFE
jgi:hypothetical protein